jgi:prolipoprotein diacylglyceryltransferase
MFVVAFGLGWYIMKHIFEKGESIEKLDSLFIWTVDLNWVARLGHVFFMIGILPKSFN